MVSAGCGGAQLSESCCAAARISNMSLQPFISRPSIAVAQRLCRCPHIVRVDETAAGARDAEYFLKHEPAPLVRCEVMQRSGRNNGVKRTAYRLEPIWHFH